MLFTLEGEKTFDFLDFYISVFLLFFFFFSSLIHFGSSENCCSIAGKKKKNQVKPGLGGSQMHYVRYTWPSEHKRPCATVWVFQLSAASSHWCSTFRANHEHICARPLKCVWVSACVRWCTASRTSSISLSRTSVLCCKEEESERRRCNCGNEALIRGYEGLFVVKSWKVTNQNETANKSDKIFVSSLKSGACKTLMIMPLKMHVSEFKTVFHTHWRVKTPLSGQQAAWIMHH